MATTTFKDNRDRTWALTITVADLRRVKKALDIDLSKLIGGSFQGLADLISDPPKLVDVLYVLVEPQAKAQGVTDEQFGSALAGDALGQAADAFVEALLLFYPSDQREAMRKVLDAGAAYAETVRTESAPDLDGLVERMAAKAKEDVKKFRESLSAADAPTT